MTLNNIDNMVNNKLFQPSIWDDFPMKRNNKHTNKIIQPDFDIDMPTKIKLPKGFQFIELNLEQHSDRIANFLNEHYDPLKSNTSVGDIVYSPEYIEYIYQSPKKHYKKLKDINIEHWLIGIEQRESGEMYGFISAKPITYFIDGRVVNGMFVDKMCTHSELRGKQMCIVLMKELYRKLKEYECDCAAIFNTNRDIPFQPIVQPSKLLIRTFQTPSLQSHTDSNDETISVLKEKRDNETDVDNIKTINEHIAQIENVNELQENIQPTSDIHQIRLANKRDIDDLMKIYNTYATKKYRFYRIYNKKEFEHVFLPKRDLIYTYVLTNSQGEVKDFVTICVFINNRGEKVGYIQYISFFNEQLLQLFMTNILYIMKQSEIEHVIARETYGVSTVLQETLQFKQAENISSTGWYAFNYNTKNITLKECGINSYM